MNDPCEHCWGDHDNLDCPHAKEEAMFFNNFTQKYETECAEVKRGRCGLEAWYIKIGFAGFNTRANNRQGYKTKAAAEKVVRTLQRDPVVIAVTSC